MTEGEDKTLTTPLRSVRAPKPVPRLGWFSEALNEVQWLSLPPSSKIQIGRGVMIGEGALNDPHMSRRHFEIEEGLTVRDLGSHNGTRHNGVPIKEAPLKEGDVLRAGASLFWLQTSVWSAEEAAARLAALVTPVLIEGETGAGKERVAKLLHEASGRKGAFVPVNCAALSPDLVESELFGYVRGAFSGAASSRPGLFRSAHRGTLFLDEIAELPLDQQARLLRALQEQRVRPVGGDHEVEVEVRVVCATHQELHRLQLEGRFRPDLYHRLAVHRLQVPPLRKRKDQIMKVFRSMCDRAVDIEVQERLLLYPWPGNFRELCNFSVRCQTQVTEIDLSVLESEPPLEERASSAAGSVGPDELKSALKESAGVVAEAARRLGLHRNQVYRLLERYEIDASGFRS